MSLAGLDAPAVVEAHHASIADSTGWFVLKYQDGSRDTIELLKAGSGGVNEARKVVEGYPEKSPLYGLVQYRRRKIILKYVPDGTSRVLQVRLKVQFQAILDTFTPHDTVFSFTQASELTESALALATMLLPSTGSITSSSSSLRRRRLNDISEDGDQNTASQDRMKKGIKEEEAAPIINITAPTPTLNPPAPIATSHPSPMAEADSPILPPFPVPPVQATKSKIATDELPASALRARALLAKRKESPPTLPLSSPPKAVPATTNPVSTGSGLQPHEISSRHDIVLQPAPTFGLEKSLPAIPLDSPPSTTGGFEKITEAYLKRDVEQSEPLPEPEVEARPSLTAEHLEKTQYPSGVDQSIISQWNDDVAVYAAVKPKKKKLGPRPHIDTASRPRTSGTSDATVKARPVANLPTSIKISNARPTNTFPVRPGSQQSSKSVPGRFAPSSIHPDILPPLPSPTYAASLYRPESRRVPSRAGSIAAESTAIASPEKLRLMKALQIRKRNMLITQRVSQSTQASASSHDPTESLASSQTSRGIHPSGSTVKSDLNAHLSAPVDSLKQVSSTTSPTTATNLSEEHSTVASSIASREDAAKRRDSLSSDTSSSVTPKAEPTEIKRKRNSPRKSPAPAASPQPLMAQQSIQQEEEKADSALAVKVLKSTPAKSESQLPTSPAEEAYPQLTDKANTEDSPADPSEAEQQHNKMSKEGPPTNTITAQKQRLKPAPIRTASSLEHSEVSDTDSLMEELQNATVHEAKPVSVGRTPVTPVISRGSTQAFKDTSRAVSTPQSRPSEASKSTTSLEKPKSAGGRSLSTALPQWPPQSFEPVPLTKKSTLGSGISKRIKALEVVSSRQSTSPPRQPPRETTPTTRSAFSTFTKRASLIMHQQAPNASTETSPPKRLPELPPPEHQRAAEGPKMWRQRQEVGGVLAAPGKGESVSVTARIIRDDPESGISQSAEASDYMYRSPLIVEHGNSNRDLTSAETDATPKTPKSEKGRFSFSSHRSQSHPKVPSDSLVSKLIFSGSRNKLPRSTSDNSSIAEERPKSSRAGRLMQRVSNLKAGRKSTKDLSLQSEHPAAIEEEERESRPSMVDPLLHVVDIGDVNVQFPDSLLWKRRFIRIDDQGYLIFSPPANEANARAVSRKYHLADFKAPTLPDLEREEMAYSVVLEMKDGSSLQCACESKSGQRQVLQMLVDAHSAYHQLYGN